MRASISKPTPHIYLAFEKKQTHSYTWSSEMLTYSYSALYLLLVVRQIYIAVNSLNTKRTSSPDKSLSEIYTHIPGCQKVGPVKYEYRKIESVIYFLLKKKGLIVYLAALKKGDIRCAHPYYAIYMKLTPPPPAHPNPREG